MGTDAEQGLLGLALHPTEPYAYVTVERDEDATTIEDMPFRSEILRFTSHDGGKTFDPASEKLILRLDRPTTYHYAGTLEFGPDGYLDSIAPELRVGIPHTCDAGTVDARRGR